mgnify:CR=1 FL=1
MGLSVFAKGIDGNQAIAMGRHLRPGGLHDNPETGFGPFGGLFPGRGFVLPNFPVLGAKLEIGVEFEPAPGAAHEHSPDIRGDAKRLLACFAVFDDVIIIHGYCYRQGRHNH